MCQSVLAGKATGPKLDRKTKLDKTRVYIVLNLGSLSIPKILSSLSMVTS